MGKKDQRTIDDLYEVMEAILKEQQMIKKLLESNHAPATQAQTSQRVFPKGKYKGKTPAQVLDIEPSYIEFIYKTYILQQNAHSDDWSMVTEDHYNAALSRGAGGRAAAAASSINSVALYRGGRWKDSGLWHDHWRSRKGDRDGRRRRPSSEQEKEACPEASRVSGRRHPLLTSDE